MARLGHIHPTTGGTMWPTILSSTDLAVIAVQAIWLWLLKVIIVLRMVTAVIALIFTVRRAIRDWRR
jgi:hypothetical protein